MLLTARRAVITRRLVPIRYTTNSLSARTFSHSSCSRISLSLPIPHLTGLQGRGQDVLMNKIRQQKYDDLVTSFCRGFTNPPNPNTVWACYMDLLQYAEVHDIPLEIHREVLRKCAKDHRRVRSDVEKIASYGKMKGSLWSANPHQHEKRFLQVMSNIRKAGYTPDVEDYNFILQQFAVVGHHIGAARILQEMAHAGLEMRTKSYGLCLQAIARRLTMPRRIEDDRRIQEECAQVCLHVLNAIRARLCAIPSACLDLTLRIMKDTGKTESFKDLLKVGYGVDLDYPDRLPLDWQTGNRVEPLSTATLTTIVDYLGRKADVSKMVTAFEVLSAPLAVTESQNRQIAFDDEDDDLPAPSDQESRPLPYAIPNITTYNTLVLRCAQARHTVFAKHYLLLALEHYRESASMLREEVQTKTLAEVVRPSLEVNHNIFRPLLGLANRDRDVALLKWVMKQHRIAWKLKREEFKFFSTILATETEENPPLANTSREAVQSEQGTVDASSEVHIPPSAGPSGNFFSHSTKPVSVQSQNQVDDTSSSADVHPLDINIDDFHRSSPSKPLDLAFYVQSLRNDSWEMRELDKRIGIAMSRLHVRVKEKLGRRVWKRKNVYLKSQGRRIAVSREDWAKMVNFIPTGNEQPAGQEKKPVKGIEDAVAA